MNEKAFSADGFIISQDNTADIPYGHYQSIHNGCGWIASYNLFKLLGQPREPLALSQALAQGSPFNCRLGTGPRRLRRWLQAAGVPLQTAHGRKKVAALASGSRHGILFYFSSFGPHYVAYTAALPDADTAHGQPAAHGPGLPMLRFFNAVDGAEQHLQPMAAFLREHARPGPVYLMAVLSEASL